MSLIGSRNTGRLTKISVTTGGTGYTAPPTVVIAGGTGATAYAHISGGRVESVAVAAGGSGFTGAATVSFTGGGGTGAAATAYAYTGPLTPLSFFKGRYNDMYGVDGMGRGIRWDGDSASVEAIGIHKPAAGPSCSAFTAGATGFVKAIQVVNGGAGYNNTPTVSLSGGTPSVAASAVASVSNGRVTRVRLTEKGAGYQQTPSVSLSGGIGSGAQFGVSVVGKIAAIEVVDSGTAYDDGSSVLFSSEQGLERANANVVVNASSKVSAVNLLAAGTGATTTGVTAVVVRGGTTVPPGSSPAEIDVQMAYSVSSVTVANSGTGYFVPPIITFIPAIGDNVGAGAGATASVNASGQITGVHVFAGGLYRDIPTVTILDTTAQAMATMGQVLRGKYKCAIRYIDDTPALSGGPVASSISELIEVDAGDASGGITWSFAHHGLDDRVAGMELWRTTANQDVILFRVATIARDAEAFTGTYSDTLDDDDLKDATRDGYGLMPITLPSGQINARRFEPPPPEFAVGCMFQDRAWYAVDTTGERPNSLMFSEIDEPESVPPANELIVQENTGTPDKVVALIPLGSELLVAQRAHIYKLSYVAQPVIDASITLGCYRGVLNSRAWDVLGGVAFLADDNGLYAYDGSSEEAVSAPVDNYWRDGLIDFTKSDKFHLRADMSTRTVRFYYCAIGDTEPVRALCYCVATKAWWAESYADAATATCQATVGGQLKNLVGTSGGSVQKSGGLTDAGAAISYTVRTGNMAISDQGGSRALGIVYKPTSSDADLRMRLYYNNSASPRASAISSDRGGGFVTVGGSTDATLNMKQSRSPLGDSNGFAVAYHAGHLDPRSVGGDRHMAVELAGQQTSDAVTIHNIAIDGVE